MYSTEREGDTGKWRKSEQKKGSAKGKKIRKGGCRTELKERRRRDEIRMKSSKTKKRGKREGKEV